MKKYRVTVGTVTNIVEAKNAVVARLIGLYARQANESVTVKELKG